MPRFVVSWAGLSAGLLLICFSTFAHGQFRRSPPPLHPPPFLVNLRREWTPGFPFHESLKTGPPRGGRGPPIRGMPPPEHFHEPHFVFIDEPDLLEEDMHFHSGPPHLKMRPPHRPLPPPHDLPPPRSTTPYPYPEPSHLRSSSTPYPFHEGIRSSTPLPPPYREMPPPPRSTTPAPPPRQPQTPKPTYRNQPKEQETRPGIPVETAVYVQHKDEEDERALMKAQLQRQQQQQQQQQSHYQQQQQTQQSQSQPQQAPVSRQPPQRRPQPVQQEDNRLDEILEEMRAEKEQEDRLNEILPKVKFDCRQRPEGYYADTEFDCEVFHYCGKPDGRRFTFFCPPGSKFNQIHMICDYDRFQACGQSREYYYLNENIYPKETADEMEIHSPMISVNPPHTPTSTSRPVFPRPSPIMSSAARQRPSSLRTKPRPTSAPLRPIAPARTRVKSTVMPPALAQPVKVLSPGPVAAITKQQRIKQKPIVQLQSQPSIPMKTQMMPQGFDEHLGYVGGRGPTRVTSSAATKAKTPTKQQKVQPQQLYEQTLFVPQKVPVDDDDEEAGFPGVPVGPSMMRNVQVPQLFGQPNIFPGTQFFAVPHDPKDRRTPRFQLTPVQAFEYGDEVSFMPQPLAQTRQKAKQTGATQSTANKQSKGQTRKTAAQATALSSTVAKTAKKTKQTNKRPGLVNLPKPIPLLPMTTLKPIPLALRPKSILPVPKKNKVKEQQLDDVSDEDDYYDDDDDDYDDEDDEDEEEEKPKGVSIPKRIRIKNGPVNIRMRIRPKHMKQIQEAQMAKSVSRATPRSAPYTEVDVNKIEKVTEKKASTEPTAKSSNVTIRPKMRFDHPAFRSPFNHHSMRFHRPLPRPPMILTSPPTTSMKPTVETSTDMQEEEADTTALPSSTTTVLPRKRIQTTNGVGGRVNNYKNRLQARRRTSTTTAVPDEPTTEPLEESTTTTKRSRTRSTTTKTTSAPSSSTRNPKMRVYRPTMKSRSELLRSRKTSTTTAKTVTEPMAEEYAENMEDTTTTTTTTTTRRPTRRTSPRTTTTTTASSMEATVHQGDISYTAAESYADVGEREHAYDVAATYEHAAFLKK